MGGIEFNKIFAAILVAGITAMLAGFFSEKIVHPEKLKENAFKIEGVESAEVAQKIDLPEPILAMIETADIERGAKISKACAACHSFNKGGANGVGPYMWDVVNREKQVVADYKYSGVLDDVGDPVWNYSELNKFLWKPKKYTPGTKMNYIGLRKPEDRAAIIAWLRMLSDSPAALPTAAEIAAEEAELAPPEPEVEEEVPAESEDASEVPAES
ncbi:MAG: cytochrome c family protein [Pseudomonadota bacterium]